MILYQALIYIIIFIQLKMFALTPDEEVNHKAKAKTYKACKTAIDVIRMYLSFFIFSIKLLLLLLFFFC